MLEGPPEGPPRPPAGSRSGAAEAAPGLPPWLRGKAGLAATAVATTSVVGSLMAVAVLARPLALAFDLYLLLGMLRHLGASLPPAHIARRAARAAVGDGGRATTGEAGQNSTRTDEQSRELRRLRATAAGLAGVALAAGAGVIFAWPATAPATAVAAAAFLGLQTKITRRRTGAGLPPLSARGQMLRDVADACRLPTWCYLSGVRGTVAPLTVAAAVVGLGAGAGGTIVRIDGGTLTVGSQVVRKAPERPAPTPSITSATATGPTRPACAQPDAIGPTLRLSGLPAAAALDLEAEWRRFGWPTLGCVGPATRVGAGWYVRVQGAPSGDSLLVHIDGRALVVHDRFAGEVLALANSLDGIGSRVDFGAGQHQILRRAGRCRVLMTAPQGRLLLLPGAVAATAADIGRDLGGFAWVTDQPLPGRYRVDVIVPTDQYPGHVISADTTIEYDQSGGRASAEGYAPHLDSEPCAPTEDALRRLASALAASARTAALPSTPPR